MQMGRRSEVGGAQTDRLLFSPLSVPAVETELEMRGHTTDGPPWFLIPWHVWGGPRFVSCFSFLNGCEIITRQTLWGVVE